MNPDSVAKRLLALKGVKRDALNALLQHQGVARPRIRRCGPAHDAPLSSGQQRLWFLHQWNPESAAYNVPAVIPLPAHVDAGVVQRAVAEIVRRHWSLRTVFQQTPDGPVQRVLPETAPALHIVGVNGESEHHRRLTLTQMATQEAQRPFNLTTGPLLRSVLYELQTSSVLLLTMPHIVSDGWSVGIVVHELTHARRRLRTRRGVAAVGAAGAGTSTSRSGSETR